MGKAIRAEFIPAVSRASAASTGCGGVDVEALPLAQLSVHNLLRWATLWGRGRSRRGRPLIPAAWRQPKASTIMCLVTAGQNFAEFDELRVSHGQPCASSPRRRTDVAAVGRSRARGSVGGTFAFGFRLEVVPPLGPL